MMKRYIKQKIKHEVKLYLTRVSVRQMKKQHSETKRSMKRRKKENRNNLHVSGKDQISSYANVGHSNCHSQGSA